MTMKADLLRKRQYLNGIRVEMESTNNLCPFATDATSELDILRHDGHTLGVDGAQVGVLKQTNKVGLRGLLQCKDSRALEAQVSLVILSNFAHQALEGKLADQKISRLLVLANLTQSDRAGAVAVGLLDTAGRGCRLTGGLGGELLAGGLATGGLARGLLGSGHGC